MPAFGFKISRLANVVQQSATASEISVQSPFLGHLARQKYDFHRMPQHVLAIARAKSQPAQQMNDLWIEPSDFGFLDRLFAELLYALFHLRLSFVHHLFNPRRMDSAVGNQF